MTVNTNDAAAKINAQIEEARAAFGSPAYQQELGKRTKVIRDLDLQRRAMVEAVQSARIEHDQAMTAMAAEKELKMAEYAAEIAAARALRDEMAAAITALKAKIG